MISKLDSHRVKRQPQLSILKQKTHYSIILCGTMSVCVGPCAHFFIIIFIFLHRHLLEWQYL